MFANLLRYQSWRYLWWALASIVAGFALYTSHASSEPPNGGTWQGYVLGTWAALLIVWLAWLGVRKRSYRARTGTVQGWTSAHVYLGLAVWVLATLHCGLQFGWNIHTVAWALMTAVILSGVFGLYVYINYPVALSSNRAGHSRSDLFAELYELNRKGRELAARCSADVQLAVQSSIAHTTLGGGVLAQLGGRDRSRFETLEGGDQANIDQVQVIDLVAARLTRADRRAEVGVLQDLLAVICRRQSVLRRLRADIRIQGWLKAWLYIHVPLTFGTLTALVAHIVSTFIYW
ncbi:MAG: hypothetical protein ACKOBM_01295 [Gammaproteobacteria bacterium]